MIQLSLQYGKPRLLDLFCGAGGCAEGYRRAGFEVVGVDIKYQKRFPFEFIQGDALEFARQHGHEFDVIHASPPCQRYSVTKGIHGDPERHPDLVDATRDVLRGIGKPFVIENVPGAPLNDPLMLCGTMFDGLKVYRHRLFECGGFDKPEAPRTCNHTHRMGKSKGEYHTLDKSPFITCVGHNFQARSGRIAMGIPWMTRDELAQAIPPTYTEYIGKQLLDSLG